MHHEKSFPGRYQLSKLSIAKIREIVGDSEPDDAIIELLCGDERAGVRTIGDRLKRDRERALRQEARQRDLAALEERLSDGGKRCIAGVDEAGRGPLAGPVVAASVILPPGFSCHGIDDSKKLSSARREELFEEITSQAVAWGVGMVDNVDIDTANILEAAMRAMRSAVATMGVTPDIALVDGNRSPGLRCDERLVVDGDARCRIIAAASIVAKVTRDRLMRDLDAVYPQYGFAGHKGYGAESHVEAIRRHGPCDIHRISFRLVPRVAPKGTTAAVLAKRLKTAPDRKAFRATVRSIAHMREDINRYDLELLREAYRENYRRFSR
jgi:ribonuclease HII